MEYIFPFMKFQDVFQRLQHKARGWDEYEYKRRGKSFKVIVKGFAVPLDDCDEKYMYIVY